jgi:hypothetical protein
MPGEPPGGLVERQDRRGSWYCQEEAGVARGATVGMRTVVRMLVKTCNRILDDDEYSQHGEHEEAQAKLAPPPSPRYR